MFRWWQGPVNFHTFCRVGSAVVLWLVGLNFSDLALDTRSRIKEKCNLCTLSLSSLSSTLGLSSSSPLTELCLGWRSLSLTHVPNGISLYSSHVLKLHFHSLSKAITKCLSSCHFFSLPNQDLLALTLLQQSQILVWPGELLRLETSPVQQCLHQVPLSL